jgi:serine protease inhibitor
MKTLILIIAMSCILGCGGTGVSDSSGRTRKDSPEDLKVKIETATMALKTGAGAETIASSNQFGFKLMSLIAKSKPDENLFISPLSISMALAMTYNGASGDTADEMAKTLGINKINLQNLNDSYKSILFLIKSVDPKIQTVLANSIWTRLGVEFKQEFLQQNQEVFSAQIETLDFQNESAVKTINDWVKQKTNGKITDLISSIPDNAVMYLINAIYFKGVWSAPFKESNTHEADFYLADGSHAKVEMMRTNQSVRYLKGNTFTAVALPYGSGRTSMVIVLPSIKITEFMDQINEDNFVQWFSSMRTMDGNISIPKWKSETEYKLNEALSAL